MSIPFIDLKSQYQVHKPEIDARIHAVLDHGQYIMGPEVKELEKKLQDYTQAKHCITVASGTEALLISLMALGIGPGDEVITTPFTFVATAEVIVSVGATPVFVDIQPDTCNIDPEKIEKAITSNTKAIMSVSLYGQPADMDAIIAISKKNNDIPVIEDAAQSFGAAYKGKKSCNLSNVGCTSFFPSKPLGCYGDGGAIFTNDDGIAQACREIRVHGQSDRYMYARVGVNGRMDTMQCAVVLAKIDYFDSDIEARIAIGQRYNYLMDKIGVDRVVQKECRGSVFSQYTIMVDDRNRLQEGLRKENIPTAVHYPMPINRYSPYSIYYRDCMPVSGEMSKKVISLPMGIYMSEREQDFIVGCVERYL